MLARLPRGVQDRVVAKLSAPNIARLACVSREMRRAASRARDLRVSFSRPTVSRMVWAIRWAKQIGSFALVCASSRASSEACAALVLMTNLRRLRMDCCAAIPACVFEILPPALEYLLVHRVSANGAFLSTTAFARLPNLTVARLVFDHEHTVVIDVRRHPSLHTLDVRHTTEHQRPGLRVLGLPDSLRTLSLDSPTGIQILTPLPPGVADATLRGVHATALSVALGHPTNLRRLTVHARSALAVRFDGVFASATALETLVLSAERDVMYVNLRELASLPRLRHMDLIAGKSIACVFPLAEAFTGLPRHIPGEWRIAGYRVPDEIVRLYFRGREDGLLVNVVMP